MMTPQQYISDQLQHLKKIDGSPPQGRRGSPSVADQIFHSIMSKKFRKYAVDETYRQQIRSVIDNCIQQEKPIPFVWVFGGYKLWSLEETPEVDWAELFSMMYFLQWLKPIVQLHKPGVEFDFFSDDVIISRMNNVPEAEVAPYRKSFQELLHFIQPFLPSGFAFHFNRVIDQYPDAKEFDQELQTNIQKLTQERGENFPLTDAQVALINLNVKQTPTLTSDPYWKQKVQIMHDAYSMSSKRRPYYRNPNKIMVMNTPLKGAIAVGTTKNSVAKFWVGVGALEKMSDSNNEKESYAQRILSPSQLQKVDAEWVDISIKDLDLKNFRRVRVINNFSHT